MRINEASDDPAEQEEAGNMERENRTIPRPFEEQEEHEPDEYEEEDVQ